MTNNKFSYGCAFSGPQTEGNIDNKLVSNWDYLYETKPELFHNNVGPSTLSDLTNNFTVDVKLMQDMGLQSIRTSISWCRLFLDAEANELNDEGVAFYKRYFQAIKDANIELFVNLSHFDLPIKLQDNGGFSNQDNVELYLKYANACFELFDDLVDKWFTFNEPIVTATCTYMLGYHYPMEVNPQKMFDSILNMIYANSLVIESYHKKYNKEIGIILNLSPVYTEFDTKEDLEARDLCDLMHNKIFTESCIKGVIPSEFIEIIVENNLEFNLTDVQLKVIKDNPVTTLGINYYQPIRVKAPITKTKEFDFNNYYHVSQPDFIKINPHRGWEIYPKGLYDICIEMASNYADTPFYIAENGIGVENESKFYDAKQEMIIDQYRIDFYQEHLYYLEKGIDHGANCYGYHTWTFIDNWSWLNAYKNRYGFIALDPKTGKRSRKLSSYWYADLIKSKTK